MPYHELVSQLRQRQMRKVKGYCLDTNEGVLSTADGGLTIYEEDNKTFHDLRKEGFKGGPLDARLPIHPFDRCERSSRAR